MRTNPNDFIGGLPIIEERPEEHARAFAARADRLEQLFSQHPPLTKREMFSAFILSGMVTDPRTYTADRTNIITDTAVDLADHLIKSLNRKLV